MESVYEICFYGGLILAILLLITAIILFIALKIPRVFGELTGRIAKKQIADMKGKTPTEYSASKQEKEKYYNQNTGKIVARETKEAIRNKKNNKELDKSKRDFENLSTEETEVLSAHGRSVEEEATAVLMDRDEDATDVLTNRDEDTTDVLTNGDEDATDVLTNGDDDATDVLTGGDEDATDVLTNGDDDATDVLTNGDEDATDVLTNGDEDATDVLRSEAVITEVDDEGETIVLTSGQNSMANSNVKTYYNIVVVHTDESL